MAQAGAWRPGLFPGVLRASRGWPATSGTGPEATVFLDCGRARAEDGPAHWGGALGSAPRGLKFVARWLI